MNRRAFIVLAAAGATAAAARAEDPPYIGVATMQPDGRIEMRLRAIPPGGGSAEGFITYKPGDPDYAEMLVHLGGLKPGETKLVPRWPDPPSRNSPGTRQ